MSVWWDKDKSEKVKGITCRICITHPELIQTGEADPRSLKCPVCKVIYNHNGIKYDEEEHANKLQLELEEEVEDSWNTIWGGLV